MSTNALASLKKMTWMNLLSSCAGKGINPRARADPWNREKYFDNSSDVFIYEYPNEKHQYIMARIRTVKPTHWNDKEQTKISLPAHLLWIGLWNFSDDEGVFENDPYLIKSQIFPRRTDIRTEQVTQWLDQLSTARFIIPFSHEGVGYYIHRTFKAHQKIDRPQPSKIPL